MILFKKNKSYYIQKRNKIKKVLMKEINPLCLKLYKLIEKIFDNFTIEYFYVNENEFNYPMIEINNKINRIIFNNFVMLIYKLNKNKIDLSYAFHSLVSSELIPIFYSIVYEIFNKDEINLDYMDLFWGVCERCWSIVWNNNYYKCLSCGYINYYLQADRVSANLSKKLYDYFGIKTKLIHKGENEDFGYIVFDSEKDAYKFLNEIVSSFRNYILNTLYLQLNPMMNISMLSTIDNLFYFYNDENMCFLKFYNPEVTFNLLQNMINIVIEIKGKVSIFEKDKVIEEAEKIVNSEVK